MFKLFAHDKHLRHNPWDNAPPWAIELGAMMEINMAAIDDLKSAIADLSTALTDNNAEIEALLAKIATPGASEADIAAATQSIRDLITANKTEVDKAKAAVA